ncbi:hypothetical protein E3N88_43998 [Mikania micrantha]|uniref:Elongation factor Ts, mitochondrial n=1 Tax=Mikania micrantha TaxID=192012 RepID=A0A5N6LDV3_9ASTR|nr:hypothetical protein E3N88_43998 [Mikania micrantha]
MTPVIPSSTSSISLIPGCTFDTIKTKNGLIKCCNLKKSTRRTLHDHHRVLPLSTSLRLFPHIRTFGPYHQPRFGVVSATGVDVDVTTEQADQSDPISGQDSSQTSEPTSTVDKSKQRSRPARKSEMPPVKNEELVPGATFTGKVRSIQPFGAFVDFGAFTDGLVHVSRLSDGYVKEVANVVSVGQEVKVKLVEANIETGRIALTMRESEPATGGETSRPPRKTGQRSNQRRDRDEGRKSTKFVKGQELEGTVKNLTRSGAFINLPEGEEGFLPSSEEADEGFGSLMGDGSKLEIGQEVKVWVLRIARGQVTLTMKREDDNKDLDSKLQGKVFTATNPFLVAFRNNKDIASFLDDRKKVEGDNVKISSETDAQPEEKVEVPEETTDSSDQVSTPENVTQDVDEDVKTEPVSEEITSEEKLEVSEETTDSSEQISTPENVTEGLKPYDLSIFLITTISPALVKQLREETGAGMMDCKKALAETKGDLVKAQEYLRKKGLASADKKASRATAEGRIGSYIHDSRIGVLLEVNCETDFVSRGDIFKDLVNDLAMQVAACPQVQYLVPEDVPKEIIDKEREIEMQKEDLLSKPEQFRSKIVDGRIKKRLDELALLEQAYIKNDKVVVKDFIKSTIATIGENIKVKRFVRFNLGEGLEKKTQDFAAEVAAQTAAKKVSAPTTEPQPAVTETVKTVDEAPKATISAALVKQLREETGAGMMDCKKALSETGGDIEKAQEYLRKKGLSTADKKSARLAAEGRIGSYIHDSRIGVLIEVNCETDFVGRSEKFKELVDDLAMQVVACPKVEYVSIEDIPESIVNKEKDIEMQREDILSKPENIRAKIVDGRVSKRLGELALLEQPFLKDDSVLVKDFVKQTVAAIGENIKVRRFVRFTLGESEANSTETES